MNKSPAEKALWALAKEDKGRTKTARLREMLDAIEAAKQAGVSNARVVETLNAEGFDLTLKTFETMLYRIRKKQQAPAKFGHDQTQTTAPNHDEEPPAINQADEKVSLRTARQRGEAKADEYMKPTATNPLLKRLNKVKE